MASRLARPIAAVALAASTITSASDATAQSTTKHAALPPAPLSIRVIAPSPDPPWTLRIDNEGDRPVRIPADIRLLSFEIQRPGKGNTWQACRPAPGQKPGSFPTSRAVYLAPGESWVESFDPRLFCFGLQGDRLRGGTLVRPRFGFGAQTWSATREPFAAQSTDEPESFAPARELRAPTFVLSYAPAEIAPISPAPLHATRANEPLDKAPLPPPPMRHDHDHDHDARGVDTKRSPAEGEASKSTHHADLHGSAEATATPSKEGSPPPKAQEADPPLTKREIAARRTRDEALELDKKRDKERQLERDKELREAYVDETIGIGRRDGQAPDLDMYVDGWSDGGAPRDVTLRIHAKNEGGRTLAAVLRTRMLRFRVEGPMTPQNQTPGTIECNVDDRAHGVAVELVREYRPGAHLDIPFLLAEVCPRGTFDRPGLFRVTPLLVSNLEGEAVVHRDAFQGRVRALQPALARIGASRLPFYDAPPRTMKTVMIGRDPDDPVPDLGSDEETTEPASPPPR